MLFRTIKKTLCSIAYAAPHASVSVPRCLLIASNHPRSLHSGVHASTVLAQQQQQSMSAMLRMGHVGASRPLLAHQRKLAALPNAVLPSSRHFGSQIRTPARRQVSWQLKAESGGGSGAGGGAGGKKGYSSGDGAGDGGLWGAYNRMLESNPLLVKAITTAILSAVGNIICQALIEKQQQLDTKRLTTFTALGFVWVAPWLHFWFGALNRIVTAQGNAGALMRMALDQLGFAPIFISSMIAILTLLDGKAVDQAIATVKSDLPSAIKANWMLWVPAQFLNFRFIPGNYQVLFANMVALVWNVYFSFATRPKEATA